jgi:LuxR family maltose regulon positive regulatory protein
VKLAAECGRKGEMATPLLTTKLYVPRARPELVSRPRLTEQLNEGLTRKLTLVSAPAGFGKTTLLSEWLSDWRLPIADSRLGTDSDSIANRKSKIENPPVAWLSLDEGDNDPARFWAYLIAALQTVQADIGKAALAMLQSPQPLPVEAVLTALINEIAVVPHPFVLVLDDYHLIHTLPIHSALAFLLDHLPPNMHLVMASRADPPLPLARLRGRDQLTELREADLRFTTDEAAAFLNQVMGLELSDEDVAALEARTEGWIAGLQMAALSMQGRKDIPGFIAAFTGSHRYILDYLMEEVFRQQPAAVQDFLLKTSILDRFTASLCDAVWKLDAGDWKLEIRDTPPTSNFQPLTSSQQVLEYLEHSNLFIVPLDESRQWYRYHHLFADLLRHQLQVAGLQHLVPHLHKRASQWYEAAGFPADAVQHALAGSHWERAATLISDVNETMLKRGELITLLGWLQALPDEVVRARPPLCLHCGWALILTGQLDAAESYLAQAEQAAQDDAPFLGWIVAAQAFIARMRGDDRRTIELSPRALSLLPSNALAPRSVVAMNLGIAHWSSGHLTEAEQALTAAYHAAQQSGNDYVRLTALGFLGLIQATWGKLHRAAESFRQAIGAGEQLPPVALAAADHLQQGIELGQRSGNLEIQIGGYRTLARLKQAQGDASAALDALQKAHQLARERDVPPLERARNAACHVQIALAQDDMATAIRWAEQVTQDADASPFYPLLDLTPARLLLAQNEKAAAAEQLAARYETALRADWQFGVVEVRVLQALAAPTSTAALSFLADTLMLAQPEGYVRTFVDKGEPMAALLEEAASQDIAPEYVGKLLAALDLERSKFQIPGSGPLPSLKPETLQPETLVEPLSERELKVVCLLADGLTNQEIAQALFVSVNTVKTHLKNIYSKLGVHNRREATAQAKKLGLLA